MTTTELNNANMNNLINGEKSTTSDITTLQDIETELLQTLEMNLAQGNLTESEINTSIEQINQISSMRMNLYDSLGSYNQFYQTNLKMANDTLYQQTEVLDILENKLNENKKKILALAENKNNNIRLAEINSYYSEKYKAQARFMKIVIILILPVLISAILLKRGLIPYKVFKIISVIIGVISFFFLVNQLFYFSTRNNMVYSQKNIAFNTNNLSNSPYVDASANDASGNDPWFISYNTPTSTSSIDSNYCVGSNCCSTGMTFDVGTNQCIESFQSSLTPEITPSLSSLSGNPSPILGGNISKTDSPLTSKNLDYNSYKNSTNKKSKETSPWDTILSSFDQLISNKKADYTMGMNSLSGYNS
uniref:Uncharacterized protein n=1 Tax=viral metagenome TaxID=1070528 RepID=A0A6C0E3Z0_9ZZZZ